ncbi:sensor histidine kinase KdpD [uncultured Dubosiella sp.]|nr:HAMP domain-containing sensor histidine kinase [uncultured Dubosiella sp.]
MSARRQSCLLYTILLLAVYVSFCMAAAAWPMRRGWIWVLGLGAAMSAGILGLWIRCDRQENEKIRQAADAIKATLFESRSTLLSCDEEGAMACLFQDINTLIATLDARYAYEKQEKDFYKDLIRDISHQLKTPLATLSIHHELLHLYARDEQIQEVAALCERETSHMSDLIEKLLVLARLDAGAMTISLNHETLRSLIEEAVERFESRAAYERKRLGVRWSEDDDLSILCDRFWLGEALANLIKNALDHTKENDSIVLETKRSLQSVQIMVRDSGEGIDPRDMPHIFKRFYRSPRSNTHQGSGLGLPLARAIVEAHHGTLRVQNEPGSGACFTISLLLSDKIVGKPSGRRHIVPL